MTASVGAKSAMSKTAEAANTSAIASAIAENATTSGIVIAASDPSTTSRTTIATATPMSSVALCGACSAVRIAWPPSSTCRPAVAAGLGGVDDALHVGLLELVGLAVEEQRSRTRRGRPADTAPGPAYGLCTAVDVRQALDALHDAGDLGPALAHR